MKMTDIEKGQKIGCMSDEWMKRKVDRRKEEI